MSKHSYRKATKRNLSNNILFCLQDMEDAKTTLSNAKQWFATEKERANFEKAYTIAQGVLDGSVTNISMYSPCINQIKAYMKAQPTQINFKQTSLF